MPRHDKTPLIVIGLVAVLYVFLRARHLTDSCLVFDEIFSVHAATQPWQNLFWFVAQDLIHPPLFYILLKIWISVGGESLLWTRLFPVLFSVLAVIPFLLLCRQLKLSHSTTALALTFFAVNGSLIKYAQEVRMYSLLLCLALFSIWLFARFLNSGKNFFLLAIVNILLVYAHYFGWLIVASEIFAALLLAREKLKQTLLLALITVLSFALWIFALRQASKINSDVGQNIGWMTKPDVSSIFQFIFDLFEPIYFQNSSADEQSIFLITLPLVAVGAVAFVFYFVDWKNQNACEKRNFFLLSIFTFAPISLAFAASRTLPYSVWGTRHLIIAFAPFAVLLANAFSKIKFRQLKFAGHAAICLLLIAAFLFQSTRKSPTYIWCAWENLAARLSQTGAEQPSKIYVFEDLVAYHFWFALRDSDRKFQVVKINGIEGLIEDKAYFLPRGFDEIQTASQVEGDRFFVAFRDKDWNESAPPLQNLKAQGYQIGDSQIIEAQGLKAFLVEIKK